jgi:heterodisulfide reductase subunit C
MEIIFQILFLLIVVLSIGLFAKRAQIIRRNILLGQELPATEANPHRWKQVLLLAFGQQKMFEKPLVGLLHFVVYAGFLIINIEMLEIVLDGILGTHRLFANFFGSFYTLLIGSFEVLALGVLVACALFLVRRNVVRIKRLVSSDLAGWPKSDANYILITEIVLMALFLSMNAADLQLQARGAAGYPATDAFWISAHLAPLLDSWSTSAVVTFERMAWWLHILGVFAFLNYLPYSKHLHILLAFPNAYYKSAKPRGEMENMPAIQQEVLYAMQPELAPTASNTETVLKFGAKDATDLSWKNLLDAYACTECGRCSENCPATQTGKKLSPRLIMMKTRDRITEIGAQLDTHKQASDDGKTLLHNYITVEELRACTTCNACVEACPVSINPLDIILQMRRHLIMEEANAPKEWNGMFSNIENNMAPWKFSPDDRDAWIQA